MKLVLILAISACAGNVNTSDEAPFDLTPIPVLDGSNDGIVVNTTSTLVEVIEKAPIREIPEILQESQYFQVTSSDPDQLRARIKELGADVVVVFETAGLIVFLVDESVAKSLRADKNIPDLIVEERTELAAPSLPSNFRAPTAEQTNPIWNLDILDGTIGQRLDSKYTYVSNGSGVIVYVFDTGVQLADGTRVAQGPGKQNFDCEGHGTHVAGTIASPIYGVAKGATIVSVPVLCGTSGLSFGLGVEWVLSNHPGGPAIVNASLIAMRNGWPVRDAIMDEQVRMLRNAGIMFIAAAGNNSGDACEGSPGAAATLNVGATDKNDSLASFSNRGSCVDVLAPGVGIISRTPSGGAKTANGTSMAAPHVSGVLARLISAGVKNPVDTLIQLAHPVARNVGSTTNRVLSIIETPLPGRISNLEASISQQLLQLSWQPGSGRSDYYDVSLRELDISKTPRSGWTSPSRTNVTSLTLPISQQFFDSAGILQVQVTPGNMSGLGESIVKEFSYSPVSSPTSSIRDGAKSPVLGGSLVYILGKVNSADLFWTEEPKLALSARFTIRARSESSPDWRSIGVSDARQVRVNLAGSLSNWFEFQVSGEDGVLSTPLSNVLRLSIATTTTTVAVGGRVNGYLVGPGANLQNANLQDANLSGLNLSGSNLIGANLIGANLQGTNLSSANLYGANLGSANLRSANLNNANFTSASLHRVNMSGASVSGTNFSNASYYQTVLSDGSVR